MAKILQCLICFTVIMTAARTERNHFFYTGNEGGDNSTELATEAEKSTLHHIHLVSESISRNQETRRYRRESGSVSGKPLKVPEECEKKGYCEHVPDYPTKLVNKILEKLKDSVNFKTDILNDDLGNLRSFSSNQNKDLCESKTEIVYPQRGMDVSGNWQDVVNSQHKRLQGVRVEHCTNPHDTCNNVSIQENFKGNCTQHFSYRMMVIVKDGKLQQERLKLPTACHCGITYT